MANLPEKNITTVDKITSIPSNTNLYINANGEFRQATVDDVLKASPVIADSITNQYKNASGSPILLTDSAKGVAINFKVKGGSTQTQYSGKNLFNVNNLPTVSGLTNNNGVLTITNNYTILVAMALSELADLVVGETYTLSFKTTSTNNFIYVRGAQYQWTNGTSLTITQAMLDGGINLYGVVSGTVTISDIQIEKGTTVTNYEPYVGGTASPNPSYPQAIKSVGDMGYFDGELLQGYYDHTTGKQTTNTTYVCSKNTIPCNPSDNVVLQYKETVSRLSIVFYDKNMKHISFVYIDNADTFTTTIPTNAHYFHFNIGYGSSITPQTAKHICVTINGKYALIVDSVGKNLLNNTATTRTINGVTFTVNTDGSITANGTATANINTYVGDFVLEKGDYVLNGIPSGNSFSTYFMSISNVTAYDTGSGATFNVSDRLEGRVGLGVTSGVTINNVTIYPMIRPLGTSDTYEPYKKSRKYLPILAPLRGLGEVTDVVSLSECEVERKFVEVVFDGSSDEGWSLKAIGCELYLNNTNSGNALCTHYKKNNGVSWGDLQDNEFNIIGTVLRIKDNTHQSTLDEWKTWLSANPITLIYELAEPTTESIEPIDVDTFEGVTQISVSDGADMEVEYPTSKVASIASIGWSKGRRAEYDLEQLKVQMLALQTTIVSTV